jgi:hypothetical protein
VTISAGATSGASISNFTITTPTGTDLDAYTGVTSGSPLVITLRWGNGVSGNSSRTATFKLGMAMAVPAAAATGVRNLSYTVQAVR